MGSEMFLPVSAYPAGACSPYCQDSAGALSPTDTTTLATDQVCDLGQIL